MAERTLEVDERAVTVGLGFVDLVGSTAWASGLTLKEHALALAGFEAAAWDIASAHGGRVVKLIGDEAMFLAPSGADAARIALELCRAVAADAALPEARGAAGYGTVGTRDGDYFGPLVNLVARAVKVADPGSGRGHRDRARRARGLPARARRGFEVVELSVQTCGASPSRCGSSPSADAGASQARSGSVLGQDLVELLAGGPDDGGGPLHLGRVADAGDLLGGRHQLDGRAHEPLELRGASRRRCPTGCCRSARRARPPRSGRRR